jgi:NTE family protein
MGGIIAALYAAGWDALSLEREARRMTGVRELIKLVDIRAPRRGLLSGQNVRDYLAEFIDPQLTFEDLKIPTALKAVDINSGQQVDLKTGNLLDAVLATSAFPGIFPHVKVGDRSLVDGGVLNNLPLDLIAQMGANKILAVDVSPRYPGTDPDGVPATISRLPTMAQDVYRTVMLMLHAITETRIEHFHQTCCWHLRSPTISVSSAGSPKQRRSFEPANWLLISTLQNSTAWSGKRPDG